MHDHFVIDEFVGLTRLDITIEHENAAEIGVIENLDELEGRLFAMQRCHLQRLGDAQAVGTFAPPIRWCFVAFAHTIVRANIRRTSGAVYCLFEGLPGVGAE